jgi:hypothetical protein
MKPQTEYIMGILLATGAFLGPPAFVLALWALWRTW